MEKYFAEKIKIHLNDDDFDIVFLDSTDSTNTYAKRLAQNGAKEGTAVIAKSQSMGRGRLDRSFLSLPSKGIYLSLVLRPDFPVAEINSVTLLSAMAVYDTIFELTGKKPQIKWPNDVYLNGKKICGILTESSVNANHRADYIVVGVGINISHSPDDFPDELKKIATSLLIETGVDYDISESVAKLLKNFKKYYKDFPDNKKQMLSEYSERLYCLDEKICVIGLDNSYEAILKGIDDNGYLKVLTLDGEEKNVIGGEISIRPL